MWSATSPGAEMSPEVGWGWGGWRLRRWELGSATRSPFWCGMWHDGPDQTPDRRLEYTVLLADVIAGFEHGTRPATDLLRCLGELKQDVAMISPGDKERAMQHFLLRDDDHKRAGPAQLQAVQ